MRLFKRGTAEHVEVATGCPVFTSDNEALGYVSEIREGAFRVDVPLGRDYWLSESHVQNATDTQVMVDFEKECLDDFKLAEPSGIEKAHEAPIENEFVTQAKGSIISDEEQMQMRGRMERELAEQRQKLHDNAAGGPGVQRTGSR
jgi:hypothetical protein